MTFDPRVVDGRVNPTTYPDMDPVLTALFGFLGLLGVGVLINLATDGTKSLTGRAWRWMWHRSSGVTSSTAPQPRADQHTDVVCWLEKGSRNELLLRVENRGRNTAREVVVEASNDALADNGLATGDLLLRGGDLVPWQAVSCWQTDITQRDVITTHELLRVAVTWSDNGASLARDFALDVDTALA